MVCSILIKHFKLSSFENINDQKTPTLTLTVIITIMKMKN